MAAVDCSVNEQFSTTCTTRSTPESVDEDSTTNNILSMLFRGLGDLDDIDDMDVFLDGLNVGSSALDSDYSASDPNTSDASCNELRPSEAVERSSGEDVDPETGLEVVYRPLSPVGGRRCPCCGIKGFANPITSDCMLSSASAATSSTSSSCSGQQQRRVRSAVVRRLVDGPYAQHGVDEERATCELLDSVAMDACGESAVADCLFDYKFLCAFVNPRIVSPYDLTLEAAAAAAAADDAEITQSASADNADDETDFADADAVCSPLPSPLLPLLDYDDLQGLDDMDYSEDFCSSPAASFEDTVSVVDTRTIEVTSPESSGYETCSATMTDEEVADEEIDIVSIWSPPHNHTHRQQQQQQQHHGHYDVTDTPEHNYSSTRLPVIRAPPSVSRFHSPCSSSSSNSTYLHVLEDTSQSSRHQQPLQRRQRGRPRRSISTEQFSAAAMRFKRSRQQHQQPQQVYGGSQHRKRPKDPAQNEHNFKERLRRVQLRQELFALRSCIPSVQASRKRVSSDDVLNAARDCIIALNADSAALAAALHRERVIQRTLTQKLNALQQ